MFRRRRSILALGAAITGTTLVAAMGVVPAGAAYGDGVTSNVSLNTAGAQLASTSSNPSVSADGRFVVFDSAAANAISPFTDGNAGGSDVYLHDRLTGKTSLVSVSTAGATTSGNGSSVLASISANGKFVVFASCGDRPRCRFRGRQHRWKDRPVHP